MIKGQEAYIMKNGKIKFYCLQTQKNLVKKILLIVLISLYVVAFSSALNEDFYSFNSLFNPPESNFNYVVPRTNLSNVSLLVHEGICLNISGGRLQGSRCLDGDKTRFICQNVGDCNSGDFCNTSLVCETHLILSLLSCPTSLAGFMNLALIFVVSSFFIAAGFIYKAPISGILGSTMGIASSLFIAACLAIAAYMFALICVALLGWFATRGLGGNLRSS